MFSKPFRLNTHTVIYNILRNVVETGDSFPTTSLDNHVAQLFLSDFEQSGIHLPEEKRKLAVNLNEYVLHLGQRFSIGAHQAKQVNKEDLPSHIRYQYTILLHFAPLVIADFGVLLLLLQICT